MPARASNQSPLRIRLRPAERGRASVATGLPILDELLGVLADWGRFALALETPPLGGNEQDIDAVGRALGRAIAKLLPERAHGSAIAPADEALAHVVLEVSGRPLVATNVDLSGERPGGLETDVLRLLETMADEAGLTLHVRLVEGVEARHVLEAIFKALGLALRQASTPRREE